MREIAENLGIKISKIYTEAKSAKKPSNRPKFAEMLEAIESGEANGILCWQINRLSRNPVDSGRLQWLLQQGVLKSIQTMDREYRPEDNALIFSVESGVANQFVLDLSKNVKRGMRTKLEMGHRPGVAPIGYKNTKIAERGANTIIKDEDRFDMLRKCWDLMLTGQHAPGEILDKLNNEWGYRSMKRKRTGGKPLSYSGIYKMFTNPFYYGLVEYAGEEYGIGKHEPMITMDEFDRVQRLLGRPGKPRPKKHFFAFTGMIICGECGSSITATEKKKYIKSLGEIKTFVYYHCTKRKKGVKCSQSKFTLSGDLEKQIAKEIKKYTILPQFREWALEGLNETNDKEISNRTKIYESQQNAVASTQRELDELTKMRYRELIDDGEYLRQKDELKRKITKLQQEVKETEARADQWLEVGERIFNFAANAEREFSEGGIEKQKQILADLGQNFVLKDQILTLDVNEWLIPIGKKYPKLEKEYLALEPSKKPMNASQKRALVSVYSRWQGRKELNPH